MHSINPMEIVVADDGSIWKVFRERHANGWTAVVVQTGEISPGFKGVWYSTALNFDTVVTAPLAWIESYVRKLRKAGLAAA
jgi:hypothetical protein